MPENCNPNDCPIAARVEALDGKLSDFRQSVAGTNERFGSRLGKLETRNDVQDEQRAQMKEQIADVKADVAEFRREQKDSIAELRRENKEALTELKQSVGEVLTAVTPLKHDVDELKPLKKEVEEIKSKPGKTWETIKDKSLGWIVALILVILAVALGLGKYL